MRNYYRNNPWIKTKHTPRRSPCTTRGFNVCRYRSPDATPAICFSIRRRKSAKGEQAHHLFPVHSRVLFEIPNDTSILEPGRNHCQLWSKSIDGHTVKRKNVLMSKLSPKHRFRAIILMMLSAMHIHALKVVAHHLYAPPLFICHIKEPKDFHSN